MMGSNMSKLKESLGTKKLVAVVVVIASVLAFSTFTILENSRKEEEKALLALQQQKLEAIQLGHQTKTCGAFGYSLNLLTSKKFSPKKMKETNTLLNDYLDAWSIDNGESNDLHTKLSKYQRVIADSLPEGTPNKSKELLAFQKSNFNALISSCNLSEAYTFPSTLTFLSGCWNGRESTTHVELQVKDSSNSWTKVSSKNGEDTDYCISGAGGNSMGDSTGADFSVELGLMRNNLKSYGSYRVRFTKEGNKKFSDGEREIFSCELRATDPDATLYPEFWTLQDILGCDGKGNPDYKPEPENDESSDSGDYIDGFPNPWEREFKDEWSEGTAKFTWCWNRGLQYSAEADACY
jgi:type II secretory pathway pseudopilin PulG